MAMRALLCQGSLNAKSLIESLLNAPRCTPSMLLLPPSPAKRHRVQNIQRIPVQHHCHFVSILSSEAFSDPNINLPLATFWHCLAESLRIASPRLGESCNKRVVSMANASATYGRRPNMPSPTAESQAGLKAVVYRYFSLG